MIDLSWYDFTLKETGLRLDYIFLMAILFLVFIIYSKLITTKYYKNQSNTKYWKYSIFPIIVFSLIEGLRYGRGVDYLGYLVNYIQALNPVVDYEPLFMILNKSMALCGFPYPIAFCIYSSIWILGLLFLCKDFRYIAYLCIPFGLIASIPSMENLIRQFTSLGFVMVSISYLINHKYRLSILFAIISYGFHLSSVIVTLLIFMIFILKHNNIFKLKYILVLYLYFMLIFKIEYIDNVINYVLSFINLGDLKFSSYIENADKWFTSNALMDGEKSLSGKTALFLFDGTLFIMGRMAIKKCNDTKLQYKLSVIYNLFVIGAIGMQAVGLLEIVRRFFRPLYMLWFIIAAHILYEYPIHLKHKNKFINIGGLILWGYIIVILFFKYIIFTPSQMFIWDSFKYRF